MEDSDAVIDINGDTACSFDFFCFRASINNMAPLKALFQEEASPGRRT